MFTKPVSLWTILVLSVFFSGCSGVTSVRVTPDIRAEGASITWVWPETQRAQRVTLNRETQGRSPSSTVLLGTDDRSVTSFQDRAAPVGRNRYTVEFSDARERLVAEGEATLVSPPRDPALEEAVVVAERFFPSVVDFNGDGALEVLGAVNLGGGQIIPISEHVMGVSEIFNGRHIRDNRLADLDGDGDWDLVVNGYSDFEDTVSKALLFWNNGAGKYSIDRAFSEKVLRGKGETILAFDYDNDGDLDLFLPYYSHTHPDEQSYLLENDGKKGFADVSDRAGVAMRGIPIGRRVEGAQAADLNDDGQIDFFVGSHLFLNRGDGTFYEGREAAGLPSQFDEGTAFLDWNADGALDLVVLRPNDGPGLYQQDGRTTVEGETLPIPTFRQVDVLPPDVPYLENYGIQVGDLTMDGLPEMVIASGQRKESILLVNRRDHYERYRDRAVDLPGKYTDCSAFGDFDGDGRLDLVRMQNNSQLIVNRNASRSDPNQIFWVRVVGKGGLLNQQGRVVRARPLANPGFVLTRVVDGGSGYMAQNQYELQFATPFPGAHRIEVVFAGGTIRTLVRPGERIEIDERGVLRGW